MGSAADCEGVLAEGRVRQTQTRTLLPRIKHRSEHAQGSDEIVIMGLSACLVGVVEEAIGAQDVEAQELLRPSMSCRLEAVWRGAQFEASLKKELAAAEAARARFAGEFSETDFESVVGGWRAKLARVSQVPQPRSRAG